MCSGKTSAVSLVNIAITINIITIIIKILEVVYIIDEQCR